MKNEVMKFSVQCVKRINKAVHVKISKKLRTHQLEKRQNLNRKNRPVNKLLGHTTE